MTNDDIIKKWLAGEVSDDEKTEFNKSQAYSDIRKLTSALQSFRAPDYHVEEKYKKLSGKLLQEKREIPLYDKLNPLLKVAAILVAALVLGYFSISYFDSIAEESKWIAGQEEIYLPDSSLVALNVGSKIKFEEKKWEGERNVLLSGEAFFKVKEGSEFNVITKQGTVSVLGTTFGVKDWESYYEVTCYGGLVRVKTATETVLLKPSEVFRKLNNKAKRYTIQDKSKPHWLNGESSFKSVPLGLVIDELERQYEVTVETNNVVLNKLYTGSFTHGDITLALESILVPLDLDYVIKENKVLITLED